jgi:16S rRNA (uracil1498-N3)-methyltransferase
MPLAEWLSIPMRNSPLRLQLAPGAPESLAAAAVGTSQVALLIGPEGGLDEEERRAAERAGYRPCSLGPRILRTETAAVAALVLLQGIAGDLR